ncbi:hypothetical protein QWY92_02965 [Algibacter miyuki]|uniref:hypothetical protein n=1 Tax=Algibacter miyuki TaxID=1306933 RepID=UPI0025B34373|nr:hypothetical protein [Algibacter miyuki]MDN3664366.1 hypothetical protein [Algibacter miyuki]
METTDVIISKGADGADGVDGTSVTVTDNGDGTSTISDGTTTVIVSDGKDGVDGTNGVDGVSVTVTDNGDGTSTISDGTTTIIVSDGKMELMEQTELMVLTELQ